jgi:hypothetical protein
MAMDEEEYIDSRGYKRKNSRLVSRQIAHDYIYKYNRKKYPLPFYKYVVHHKDGNKLNNSISNLQILLPEEHGKIHGKIGGNLWTPERYFEGNITTEEPWIKLSKENIDNMRNIEIINPDWVIRYLFTCAKCGCHSYDLFIKENIIHGKVCMACFNFEPNLEEAIEPMIISQ